MSVDHVVEQVEGDPDYVKFLLTEAPYIRSALYARGMCYDEEYLTTAYPTTIGNAMHCDLIELELWLRALPRQDLYVLLVWAGYAPRVSKAVASKPKIRRALRLAAEVSERLEGEENAPAS